MPSITFVAHNGSERVVDIPAGWSLMEGAIKNGVSGILADCGGACSCATCHVYLGAELEGLVPPPSVDEEAMLECALDVRPNSRLSCQIAVTDAFEGARVELPESQI